MAPRTSLANETLLFSYGSNGPEQLAERLGHAVPTSAAYLDGYKRVFRGFSSRWGGGVAHLVKRANSVVYGLVARVSAADLDRLDRYEGAPHVYRRTTVTVHAPTPRKAVAYVRAERATFHPPSAAYLEACARTVGTYWRGERGRVTAADFTIG